MKLRFFWGRAWAGALALTALSAANGAHAQTYINATVGGELSPGVYGRINIGNGPPPAVIYPQPMIIHRPAVLVPRSPIYLYVPPGHAKNWSRYCSRYAACDQPVYFVKEPPRRAPPAYRPAPAYRHDGYGPHENPHDRGRKNGRDHGDEHGNGHGHGNGRGKGPGRHD